MKTNFKGRLFAQQLNCYRIARGPWFESRSGYDFFLFCDIWWLSVGSRLGQQALKSACLIVPPLFRAVSGTNLFMRGKLSKADHWLNNSLVSRIARGLRFDFRSAPPPPHTHTHTFFLPCDTKQNCGLLYIF